jgi:hypothetical protein
MGHAHVPIVRRYFRTMPSSPARERTLEPGRSGRIRRTRKEAIGFAEGVFGSASAREHPRALIQSNQGANRQETSLRITPTEREHRVRGVREDMIECAPITLGHGIGVDK